MSSQFAPIRIDGPADVLEVFASGARSGVAGRADAMSPQFRGYESIRSPGTAADSMTVWSSPRSGPPSLLADGEAGVRQFLERQRDLSEGEPAAADHHVERGRVLVEGLAHPAGHGSERWQRTGPGLAMNDRRAAGRGDVGAGHDGELDRGQDVVHVADRCRTLHQQAV